QLDRLPGVQIRGLARRGPPASVRRCMNGQMAQLPTEVPQDDAVALDEALAPARGNTEHPVGLRWRWVRTLVGRQPDPCGADHVATHVTLGAPLEHLPLGCDGPGAELGPARSMRMRHSLPSADDAARRWPTIAAHASGPSWAQLIRIQFMPLASSSWISAPSVAAWLGIVTRMRTARFGGFEPAGRPCADGGGSFRLRSRRAPSSRPPRSRAAPPDDAGSARPPSG